MKIVLLINFFGIFWHNLTGIRYLNAVFYDMQITRVPTLTPGLHCTGTLGVWYFT